MVSTWRYPSFKEINLTGPRSPLTVILFGALIYLIWNYSQPVLLAIATLYVSTGILIRAGGIIRRRFRPQPPPPATGASGQLRCIFIAVTSKSSIAIVGGESLLGKEVRELVEAGDLGAAVDVDRH